jgi:hypothetical protein
MRTAHFRRPNRTVLPRTRPEVHPPLRRCGTTRVTVESGQSADTESARTRPAAPPACKSGLQVRPATADATRGRTGPDTETDRPIAGSRDRFVGHGRGETSTGAPNQDSTRKFDSHPTEPPHRALGRGARAPRQRDAGFRGGLVPGRAGAAQAQSEGDAAVPTRGSLVPPTVGLHRSETWSRSWARCYSRGWLSRRCSSPRCPRCAVGARPSADVLSDGVSE